MCHICRKFEAVQKELDPTVLKLISPLISRLHKKIEPRLGEFWLLRHEQAVKLRTFLAKLCETVPIAPLRELLDNADYELKHIRKNMPDHPMTHSTGQLYMLKETIAPHSSASFHATPRRQREAETGGRDSRREHRRRQDRSGRQPVVQGATEEDNNLPELPGSDLNPSQARVHKSVGLVEGWLERGSKSGTGKRERHRR